MLIVFEIKTELSIIRLDFLFVRFEQVLDAVHGERRLTKDTHDFKYGSANLEVALDDGNEAVGDDGHVYLYANSVFGFSPKTFDLEMLLNPFEEQFHLPPVFIEQGNVLSTEVEVVGIVDETSMKFRRIIHNSPDSTRILFPILLFGETNALVFEHIVSPLKYALSIDNLICWPSLLPNDEECSVFVDSIESGKVKVAPVKNVTCQRLVCEPVHRVDIMHIGISDSVEDRNLRDDINLSVDSDARLCASELCPSEYRHTEINSRRVNGIEPAMKFELLRDASGLGNRYHVESELLKDAMVSEHIGLRKHLPIDGLVAKAKVFRLLTMSGCYICEFPETSAAHKLSEHKNQQMVPVRHCPTFGPVVVLGEYSPELPLGEELYYLCKNEYPCMHICSDFESDAKVSISKPGQGIAGLKRCA